MPRSLNGKMNSLYAGTNGTGTIVYPYAEEGSWTFTSYHTHTYTQTLKMNPQSIRTKPIKLSEENIDTSH